MASETIKAATDEEIVMFEACHEVRRVRDGWQCHYCEAWAPDGHEIQHRQVCQEVTIPRMRARFDADRQLIEQLVAALEALRWRQKHAEPIMWGILKDADDAIKKARAAGAK